MLYTDTRGRNRPESSKVRGECGVTVMGLVEGGATSPPKAKSPVLESSQITRPQASRRKTPAASEMVGMKGVTIRTKL